MKKPKKFRVIWMDGGIHKTPKLTMEQLVKWLEKDLMLIF